MTRLSSNSLVFISAVLTFAGAISIAWGTSHSNAIGTVSLLKGQATAKSSSRALMPLSNDEAIYINDIIATKSRSFLVIDFDDEGVIRLRPESVLEIQKYDSKSGQESQRIELLKGGLRAVTGLIGSARPKNVSYQAKNTVVGIRGTDFEIKICEKGMQGCDQSIRPSNSANSDPFPPAPIYLEDKKTGKRTVVNRPLAKRFDEQEQPINGSLWERPDVMSLQGGNRPRQDRQNNNRGSQPRANAPQGQVPPPLGQPAPAKQPGSAGAPNTPTSNTGSFSGLYFAVFDGAVTISTSGWSVDLDRDSACLIDFTSGANNVPESNPQVECFEHSLGGNNDDEEWWSEPVNGVI